MNHWGSTGVQRACQRLGGRRSLATTLGRAAVQDGAPHLDRRGYWFFIHYLTDPLEQRPRSSAALDDDWSDEEEAKIRRLEAALFLAREGLSSRKLAKLAGLADATEARTLIRHLNQAYDQEGRSFRVEEVAGGYALLTRSQFATWLRRLAHVPGEQRLSQSALETLAIVAYRQPVLRAEVEAIRGVGSSEVLKQLMEWDLVRISGRSEDLGRPYLYGTTRRFLQMFGLRSADRLPRIAWVNELQLALSSPETVDTNSEVKESTVTKSLAATALLEEETVTEDHLLPSQVVSASIDNDDDDYYDDDDLDDDEDDFDDDDSDWDDDDEEGDLDDEDEELDDDNEWEEVDDEGDDEDDYDDDDDEEDDDWGDDDDDDWD